MQYRSTRSTNDIFVSSAKAIKDGLSSDGGLFMPETIPHICESDLAHLSKLDYAGRAAFVLSLFLTDYTHDELLEDCRTAYSEERFPGGAAPLVRIDNDVTSLELWHGPTCAFKDMALQIMPRLLSRALDKTGEERTALILVATSGDTGKAALEGYKDVPGIKIKVFYPVDGVSKVQKLQMITQKGSNVSVSGIKGNFDDAQSGVKAIFANADIAERLNKVGAFLSSANSINWGRLAPQIAYYVSAYCDMVKHGEIKMGEMIDVCVPTGNFGNIFAAYIAKKMGLPICRLVCASNSNNILTDFLESGKYDRNRPFHTTMSPSMDILISSNLERLLYLICGPEKTAKYMKELAEKGSYQITAEEFSEIKESFTGYFCDEDATSFAIAKAYRDSGYLIDTHTAVGYGAALQYIKKERGGRKILLASTASPYKFACDVFASLTGSNATDEISALSELAALTGTEIPAPLRGIDKNEVRFSGSIDKEDMANSVFEFSED